jgi:hypothetical protein
MGSTPNSGDSDKEITRILSSIKYSFLLRCLILARLRTSNKDQYSEIVGTTEQCSSRHLKLLKKYSSLCFI